MKYIYNLFNINFTRIALLLIIISPEKILSEQFNDVVNVGGLQVIAPHTMVNATDYSDKLRVFFKAVKETNKNCFGQYYLSNEISDFSKNILPGGTRTAFGNLSSISDTKKEAENLFVKDMIDLKLNLRDVCMHHDEILQLIDSGKRQAESNMTDLSLDIYDVKYVDLDLSKAWRGSVTLIVNANMVLEGKSMKASIASANGWILIDRTILHLIYNVRLKNIDSLNDAKNGLHNWMDAIKASNAR